MNNVIKNTGKGISNVGNFINSNKVIFSGLILFALTHLNSAKINNAFEKTKFGISSVLNENFGTHFDISKAIIIDKIFEDTKKETNCNDIDNEKFQKQLFLNIKNYDETTGTKLLQALILGFLYGYAYLKTTGRIKNEYMPIDAKTFLTFCLSSGGMVLVNGITPGSIVYFESFLLAGWSVYLHLHNVKTGKKFKNSHSNEINIDSIINYINKAETEKQQEIVMLIINNINNNGGDIRLLIEKLNKEFFVLTEEEQREETIKKILKDWADSENTSIVIYKKPAPGHSYEEEKPIYWNKAMEDFSEYSFNEVKDKTQKEIMDLMYGYDNAEFNRVNGQLRNLDENGVGYNHVVFPAQTKTGKIKQSAWNTRAIKEGGRLSFGSPEQAEIQKTLQMDPVFDCYNSKALYQHFIALINKYGPLNTEKDKILSLVYCDIDDFKRFNTEFGHKIGDVVLSTFISFIKKELRGDEDSLYRKGGDEFVALCNFVDKDTIKKRVEYMREHFSRFTIIIEFVEGQMIVSKTKHGSNLSAEAYYNMFKSSNKEIQANILEHEMNMKKGIEDDKLKNIKGKIVLPPICSTWGIVDYNYGEMLSKTSKIQKEVIEMLLNLADTAMYEGKDTGKNTVKVIEIGEIEKY